MTIQNPSTGPAQPNPLRPDDAQSANEAAQSADAGADAPNQTEDTAAADRVEISDAARTAQSEAGGDAALVDRAREALQEPSLSPNRLEELQQRVENGAYSEPKAIQQVAEQLADDLVGTA